MPRWPSRTVAWLDFDNHRWRSWSIQGTDSAHNPYVSASIRDGDRLYPALPALVAVDISDEDPTFSSLPLWQGPEARMVVPWFGGETTFSLTGVPSHIETEESGLPVTKYRWAVSAAGAVDDFREGLCGEDVDGVSYFYEYATDMEGEPVWESLLGNCDGEDRGFAGIIYHEVAFLDPNDLPADFFDPKAARDELVADRMSAFTRLYGTPYWLGFDVGPYILGDVELCGHRCLELLYLPSDLDDTAYRTLSLRMNGHRGGCYNEQLLEPEIPGAKLCSGTGDSAGSDSHRVVWDPPDFHVTLVDDDGSLSDEEFIAAAANLRPYDGPTAPGAPPILTMEDVRLLVADWLDMVCLDQWATTREYRDSVVFEYDLAAGEWRGRFGPLGEWIVEDPGDPVAWPMATRELCREQGGSFPPGYAECALEEGRHNVEALAQQVRPEEALARLSSYRWRERIRNDYVNGDEGDSVQYFEGSYVAPDRAEVRWWPTAGDAPLEPITTVVVGNRRWVSQGNGWQEERAAREAVNFGPADHLDDFMVGLYGLEPVTETVNGVPSLRYDLAVADVKDVGFISLLTAVIQRTSPRLEAHLWLAEDGGWPVRLVLSAPAEDDGRMIEFEYSMDIMDPNDPEISIDPPLR